MKKQVSASSGAFTKPTAALTPTELIRLENFKTLARLAVGGAATLSQLLGPSEKVITKRINGLEPIEGAFAFVIEDELKLPANWLSSGRKSDKDVPAETLKIIGMNAEQVEEHIYGTTEMPKTPAKSGKQAATTSKQPAAVASVAKASAVDNTASNEASTASAVIRVSRKPGKKPLLATPEVTSQPPQTSALSSAPAQPAVAVSDEAIQTQSFKEAPVAQSKNDQQITSFNHISNFNMLCDGRSHKKRVAELSGCTPGNVTQILASESVRPDRMAEIERRLCLPSGTFAKQRFNTLSELPSLSVDIFQGKLTTEEGMALLSKQENKTVVKVPEKVEAPVAANATPEAGSPVKEPTTRLKKSKTSEPTTDSPQVISETAPAALGNSNPPALKTHDASARALQIAEAMTFAQTASHEDVTRMLTSQFSDLKPMVSLAVSAVVGRALTGNMTEAQALQVYSLFVDKTPVNT